VCTVFNQSMAGKSHHKRKCNKSGHLLRVEPSTADLFEIFPQVAETFSNADWLNFCMSLKGYHPEIATAFIQTFNGFEARVAELTIRVSEDIIACVFDLPLDGERCFRKDKVDESSLNQFLKEDTPKPNWSTGISTKHLQETRKRHTRATNKFRLNAKDLLDSSLKGKEPIVVEDEPISPVKRKGKKTKAKIEKIPANPNLQTSSSDLLIQLAEVAEFVETKSAEGIVKEACALISNQPEKKSTKSASTKRPRKK